MDRNPDLPNHKLATVAVATREGGVDRNACGPGPDPWPRVATREGGVDRNAKITGGDVVSSVSPPARVAWIETLRPLTYSFHRAIKSPPARVAWIETLSLMPASVRFTVATREGGVDRNVGFDGCVFGHSGRHPRGWRG